MDIFNAAYILKIVIVILIAFCLFGLVISLAYLLKKRNQKKKQITYFKKKLHQTQRNDMLDKAIKNYHKPGERNYWLVKIMEINQFGEREYFYNLNEGDVSIGRDFSNNKLCVYDEDSDHNQCKIVFNKEIPGIMNISEARDTVFNMKNSYGRKFPKNYKMRAGETIRLHTFDSVSFGETKLVFYIYNNHTGLV